MSVRRFRQRRAEVLDMAAGATAPVLLPTIPAAAKRLGAVIHAVRVDVFGSFIGAADVAVGGACPAALVTGENSTTLPVLVPGEWLVALPGEVIELGPALGIELPAACFPSDVSAFRAVVTCTIEWRVGS